MHDATGKSAYIFVENGTLEMNDATGDASTVSIAAGTLTIGNAANDLTVTGGTVSSANSVGGNMAVSNAAVVTTVGAVTGNVTVSNTAKVTSTSTVGGNLAVNNSALFTGGANTNVTGTVIVNTDNANANKLNNATGAVTLTAGDLTMNDAADDVTLTTGTLIMNDATGNASTVQVDGGDLTVNDITNDLTVTGGTVTAAGTVGGNLAVSNDATVSIANDIGGTLDTDADNTLTFTGAGTVTGAVNAKGGITVQADRTFTSATLTTPSIAIEGAADVTLTAGDLAATNITTAETDRTQNVVVNANQTITGNIGTADNPIGNIVLATTGKTVNINTANFHAGVISNTANDGTVKMNNGAYALNLGADNKKLATVNFIDNSQVAKNIYATTISVADNANATIGGIIEADTFTLNGAAAKATFADGATLNSNVIGAATTQGIVEFTGEATINKDLGTTGKVLATVKFADDAAKTAALEENIYANDISMNKSTVAITKDVTITGATTTNSTTLDLGTSTLTNTGNITINGNNIVKFTMAGERDSMSGGNVVVNGNLTLAPGAALTLVPEGVGILNASEKHKFTLITSKKNEIDADKIKIETGPFQSWRVSSTPTEISLLSTDVSIKYMQEKVKDSSGGKNFEKVDAAAQAGDISALHVKTLWNKIAAAEEKGEVSAGKLQEAYDRVVKTNTGFQETVSHQLFSAENVISGRTTAFRAPMIRTTASAGNITGVAAGDEDAKYGTWVNPFYKRINQGARDDVAGYKNEAYGASFGFDNKISEDTVLGAAFTASNSYTKYKDFKTGDKTRVKSLLLSIYNIHELTDNWFMTGSATIGTNKVLNYTKKVVSGTDYEIAESKYTMTSFSAKEIFGYNYKTEQATLTPMFGLRYSRVNAAKYQETGTTDQNLFVATKASNRLEAIAGMSASGTAYNVRDMLITPEAHAFAHYSLFNKAQKSNVKLGTTDLESSSKTQRASYNAGVGLKSEYNAFEYEAAYDLQLAHKRVGHQGSFKVRMNF